MTHYRFDNQIKKTKTSWNKIAVIVFCVIAVFFVIFFVLAPIIRNVIRGPQWLHLAATQSLSDSVSMMTPKRNLIAEIKSLQEKIAANDAQVIAMKLLQDENDVLRKEVSYIKSPSDIIMAGVIAKPSQSLYNSMIIDRGARDGIVVGQLVTTQGSIALGQIASVTDRTATITLFSGPQFNDNLIIKGQNITVPTTGRGGGNFEIHIPREIVVADGDLLTLPAHPDLAVGMIKSVTFDPRDPFQTVLARTPINLQELRFVEVVK